MNWKQNTPSSWMAQSQRFAGKFIIVQTDGGDFTVEHLSTRLYCGHGTRPKRLRRIIGRRATLSEARVAAIAFLSNELCWPDWPVETVDA